MLKTSRVTRRYLNVQLHEAEMTALTAKAESLGLSVSALVRMILQTAGAFQAPHKSGVSV